jgi:hypothetical protein
MLHDTHPSHSSFVTTSKYKPQENIIKPTSKVAASNPDTTVRTVSNSSENASSASKSSTGAAKHSGEFPGSDDQKGTEQKLSQKDKLKRAVKEYGATVVVFHVGISLMSLGGFYVLVSR